MVTNRPLFFHYLPGQNDQVVHLGRIISRLGDIPRDITDSGRNRDIFYDEQGVKCNSRVFLPVVLKTYLIGRFIGITPPSKTLFQFMTDIIRADGVDEPEDETRHFVEFIQAMTRLRPSSRMKPSDLLRHAWLTEE